MEKYVKSSDFMKKFYIPSYILSPEAKAVAVPSTPPDSPIIVFINSKSGVQLGGELILSYRTLLNDKQVSDGLIEIVGFRNAWHGLVLLAPNGHGTRLAQFEFKKGAAKHAYIRMDGEPWKQHLPLDDETVKLEDFTSLTSEHAYNPKLQVQKHVYKFSDDENEAKSLVANGEEFRNFGAADTFKIPNDH